MSMPQRIYEYLQRADIDYQLVEHQPSNSSIGSALAAKVPYSHIAKAVILLDHEDRKMMAVLPANRKISLSILKDNLDHDYRLAKEQKVYQLFEDCEHGAIPPVAHVYHMDTIYDECLVDNPDVYLEAGDHQTLIKLNREGFMQLMADAKHLHFSHEFMH